MAAASAALPCFAAPAFAFFIGAFAEALEPSLETALPSDFDGALAKILDFGAGLGTAFGAGFFAMALAGDFDAEPFEGFAAFEAAALELEAALPLAGLALAIFSPFPKANLMARN